MQVPPGRKFFFGSRIVTESSLRVAQGPLGNQGERL